jgi:hypothetical protein
MHVDAENLPWRPGSAKYRPAALYKGSEIIQFKARSSATAGGKAEALPSSPGFRRRRGKS